MRRVAAPLAAGAWTSLFCGSLGINVPQLKVRGTVARTAPAESVLNGNVFDDRLGIRRREDGGYTIAHGSILEHPVTPASFRYFIKFVPALMQELKIVRLSFGREFIDEWRTPKSTDAEHWKICSTLLQTDMKKRASSTKNTCIKCGQAKAQRVT